MSTVKEQLLEKALLEEKAKNAHLLRLINELELEVDRHLAEIINTHYTLQESEIWSKLNLTQKYIYADLTKEGKYLSPIKVAHKFGIKPSTFRKYSERLVNLQKESTKYHSALRKILLLLEGSGEEIPVRAYLKKVKVLDI